MTWTPPTVKWKTARTVEPCGCVRRDRFDALAVPRVYTPAGLESTCEAHTDPDCPVGLIQAFSGEWLEFDAWHAWESAWYSWVVWHEIADRAEAENLSPAQVAEMQDGQRGRSLRVSKGIPNLHRPESDDGPWRPRQHERPVTPTQEAAFHRVYGWARREERILEIVKAELIRETGEGYTDADAYWWEGSGGDRVLHLDAPRVSTPQRARIRSALDLRFGPGALVWEG